MFGAITGNLGNNRADQLVQEATCRDMNLLMSVPLSHWKRLAWERAVSSWNTEFLASPKALWVKDHGLIKDDSERNEPHSRVRSWVQAQLPHALRRSWATVLVICKHD
ncbi:hypothetical protein TNCV_4630761 [Trichonephila clavipes]|nr:hypothetical protein TNCV_4630761 [Trichonephila clavipes]